LAKPIQETIFKSRLTITYRTNITGTVTQEPLPFRLLVLGDFTGKLPRDSGLLPDIENRRVHSIKRGLNVDHFLREIIPTASIPEEMHHLRSYIPGRATLTLKGTVSKADLEKDQQLTLRLKAGTGTFTSSIDENGMCDITGPLIAGGPVELTIASRKITAQKATLTTAGNVSGTLLDPVTGKAIGLVTGDVAAAVEIPADKIRIEYDESAAEGSSGRHLIVHVEVESVRADRTIPFPSLDAFSPDYVAANVPEIRRILVIKQLLLELQADLRNLPELRKALKAVLPNLDDSPEEAQKKLEPFRNLQQWAKEQYPLLRIEKAQAQPQPQPQPEPPAT